MSLSSFLLDSGPSKTSTSKTIDNDLDALFKSTVRPAFFFFFSLYLGPYVCFPCGQKIIAPPPVPRPSTASTSEKKRKGPPATDDGEPGESDNTEVKRKKSMKEDAIIKSPKKDKQSKEKEGKAKKGKDQRRTKKVRLEDSEDEDEDDAGLEDAYAKGRVAIISKGKETASAKVPKEKDGEENGAREGEDMKDADVHGSSDEDAEDDEGDASQLVHESLSGSKSRKDRRGKRTKEKFVPEGETAEQRNERTVFVGNVAVEVAKSKVRTVSQCSTLSFFFLAAFRASFSIPRSVMLSWLL